MSLANPHRTHITSDVCSMWPAPAVPAVAPPQTAGHCQRQLVPLRGCSMFLNTDLINTKPFQTAVLMSVLRHTTPCLWAEWNKYDHVGNAPGFHTNIPMFVMIFDFTMSCPICIQHILSTCRTCIWETSICMSDKNNMTCWTCLLLWDVHIQKHHTLSTCILLLKLHCLQRI